MPSLRHSCTFTKPQPFADVQLYFDASGSDVGYWTGHEWLVKGCVVQPVSWSVPTRVSESRLKEF
jgi:hypothetical protein